MKRSRGLGRRRVEKVDSSVPPSRELIDLTASQARVDDDLSHKSQTTSAAKTQKGGGDQQEFYGSAVAKYFRERGINPADVEPNVQQFTQVIEAVVKQGVAPEAYDHLKTTTAAAASGNPKPSTSGTHLPPSAATKNFDKEKAQEKGQETESTEGGVHDEDDDHQQDEEEEEEDGKQDAEEEDEDEDGKQDAEEEEDDEDSGNDAEGYISKDKKTNIKFEKGSSDGETDDESVQRSSPAPTNSQRQSQASCETTGVTATRLRFPTFARQTDLYEEVTEHQIDQKEKYTFTDKDMQNFGKKASVFTWDLKRQGIVKVKMEQVATQDPQIFSNCVIKLLEIRNLGEGVFHIQRYNKKQTHKLIKELDGMTIEDASAAVSKCFKGIDAPTATPHQQMELFFEVLGNLDVDKKLEKPGLLLLTIADKTEDPTSDFQQERNRQRVNQNPTLDKREYGLCGTPFPLTSNLFNTLSVQDIGTNKVVMVIKTTYGRILNRRIENFIDTIKKSENKIRITKESLIVSPQFLKGGGNKKYDIPYAVMRQSTNDLLIGGAGCYQQAICMSTTVSRIGNCLLGDFHHEVCEDTVLDFVRSHLEGPDPYDFYFSLKSESEKIDLLGMEIKYGKKTNENKEVQGQQVSIPMTAPPKTSKKKAEVNVISNVAGPSSVLDNKKVTKPAESGKNIALSRKRNLPKAAAKAPGTSKDEESTNPKKPKTRPQEVNHPANDEYEGPHFKALNPSNAAETTLPSSFKDYRSAPDANNESSDSDFEPPARSKHAKVHPQQQQQIDRKEKKKPNTKKGKQKRTEVPVEEDDDE